MSNRKLYVIFTYLMVSIIFYSCERKTLEREYRQRVVQAKTIDMWSGNTRYNIAFTDGVSEAFSFGLYSKYEVGDTVCWEREDGWWYITECN